MPLLFTPKQTNNFLTNNLSQKTIQFSKSAKTKKTIKKLKHNPTIYTSTKNQ